MRWALITLLLLSLTSTNAAAIEVIRCAYQNSNNFPFQLGNGLQISRHKPGIAVEMVLMLEQHLAVDIKLQRLPWKRAERRLMEGTIDCLFNASYKEAVVINGQYPMLQGKVDVSRRSYFNSYAIFALHNADLQWDGRTLHSHNEKKIGAERGFSVIADLKAMNLNVYEASSIEQLMKLLKHQRLIAAVVFELLGDAFLKVHRPQYLDIEKMTPPFKKKAYYLMLSHQFVQSSPLLAQQVWSGIATIRESQAFKTILEKSAQ